MSGTAGRAGGHPAGSPFTCVLPARLSDFGPARHLDNISFQEFVQESRELFLRDRGVFEGQGDFGVLVRTMHLDYLLPVPYGVHELGMSVACTRVGRTSFTLLHTMTADGVGTAFTAEVVLVSVGPDDRPVPVPEALRAALGSIAVSTEEDR